MTSQDTNKEIAILLEKFMAGETSVHEEQALAQYFRTHEVCEEWIEYKEMFALFDCGEVDVPVCSASSDSPFVAEEEKVRTLPKPVREKPKIHLVGWLLTGAAACVFLVVSLFLTKEQERTNQDAIVEVYSSPEETHLPEVQQDTEQVCSPIVPKVQPVVAKPKLAQKSVQETADPSDVKDNSELTDEQIMARYIAENFMTLEERQQMKAEEETLKEILLNQKIEKECLNDIGQIIDYEYDL